MNPEWRASLFGCCHDRRREGPVASQSSVDSVNRFRGLRIRWEISANIQSSLPHPRLRDHLLATHAPHIA